MRISYAVIDDPHGAARAAQLLAWLAVFEEDVAMVEGMQRGRASPAYRGGVFSPVQNLPTHHFHRWIARRLLQDAAQLAEPAQEAAFR